MRFILVEEHDLIRYGTIQLLGDLFPVEYILEVKGKKELFTLLEKYNFDWLILNPDAFPYENTGKVITEARKQQSDMKIVLFGEAEGKFDPSFLEKHQILGIIRHDDAIEEIMSAFEAMKEGKSHYPFLHPITNKTNKDHEKKEGPLTEREREVFDQMIKGFTLIDSARSLGISEKTIENHRRNIRKKLLVTNQQQLLKAAEKMGFLSYKED
ncbi:response regulator transcription factor [Alteribacter populi]|uniref:response regulator transcription factor n=1 Tax=Alteribacter populi TaxID=2011011 RepID=UPI000BBA49C6|nr:response regulator transcription factor [Alteribacter populi]